MPKTRELLYLSYTEQDHKVLTYGIEFNEFITCIDTKPKHILVLEGNYWGSEFDFTTRCEICHEEDIDEFIKEEVYNYGDFCWVDFADINGLKELTPSEVAELLYLGKLKQPVTSPFFSKLHNKFAYLAHDDGWWNLIYYKEIADYKSVLNNIICHKMRNIHNKSVMALSDNIIEELVKLSMDGLAIDFDRILEDTENGGFEIKMYGLGKMTDMDNMYDNYERYKAKANHSKCLEYINDKWIIQDWG